MAYLENICGHACLFLVHTYPRPVGLFESVLAVVVFVSRSVYLIIKHRVQNPRRVTTPKSIASTHARMCPRIIM